MSESPLEGVEKNTGEGKGEEDVGQPVPSDDEDDCEGYFLEPVGNNINIAEKIAEANKKLLEDDMEDLENRPRKVQFSEELVNFEPNYFSDDDYTESAQNSVISDELDLKTGSIELEEPKLEPDLEKKFEEEIPEEIPEELDADPKTDPQIDEASTKLILVLLPKEQNSSCESIIGEEVPAEKIPEKETKSENEKRVRIARPKSAKKSCDISKISPNLNYFSDMERKSWQTTRNPLVRSKTKAEESEKKNVFRGEIKVQIKGKLLKKININNLNLENISGVGTLKRCGGRPRSCFRGRSNGGGENRPKTAPIMRTCCVIQSELPQYNGLRSEYGLSAEQLQERKQKSLENRQKKKQEQVKKRQEEIRKRNENEETFQKWLFNKSKKSSKKKSGKLTDTLTRSDVYIQTHASYAANRSVPYSLDLSISKKNNNKKRETKKKTKTIAVEKLLDNMTPHFKRSFNIYLGVKP